MVHKLIEKVKVSSTLNNDARSFGKGHLTDGNDDTCWNSSTAENCAPLQKINDLNSLSQWILIQTREQVSLKTITLIFQGGFACRELRVYDASRQPEALLLTAYPKDDNSEQCFTLEAAEREISNKFRLEFHKGTDMFGRIIVYKLDAS